MGVEGSKRGEISRRKPGGNAMCSRRESGLKTSPALKWNIETPGNGGYLA
jgi:hypothetical protein